MLYALGAKYGRPPSSWLLLDGLAALSVDYAALLVGCEAEEREIRRAKAESGGWRGVG